MKKISIIIPAYNEEKFIGSLLERISKVPLDKAGFEKEVVVVDDGSSDGTFSVASKYLGVKCIKQSNQGKGRAVQNGIKQSSGDYVLVQDADLEYDPQDYLPMISVLKKEPVSAVYGSRIKGQIQNQNGFKWLRGKHPDQSTGAWLANLILSIWTCGLYGRWISDPLTAYKVYPSDVIKKFNVKTCGFETDHELTAKLIRQKVPIFEVPIHYTPRSVEEGKKIKAKDGVIAVLTLLRFRFLN